MPRVVFFWTFILLLLALWPNGAVAETRVALVIGNGAYQSEAKLPNPTRDASAIAELFKKTGFEVVQARNDLSNLEFKRALREFFDVAYEADIALVYYAGHAIQVGDENYMIPVDAKLVHEYDAEDEAISLERIVKAISPAKRLRLVILDACRDNPFAAKMQRRVATRQIVSRGLARVEPTYGDTLIAYAAKAGSTAEDGEGEHSPFTTALLKHLGEPGLDIRLAFGRVRDDVLASTRNSQEPFVYGTLGGRDITLVPAPAGPKPAASADLKTDYELVERINTKRAWQVFIDTHKTGYYVDLAHERLRLLESVPATSEPAKPSSVEAVTPEKSKESRDSAAVLRRFIEKHPTSPLTAAAQERLNELERLQKVADATRKAGQEQAQKEAEAKRKAEQEQAQKEAEAKRKAEQEQAQKEAEAKRQTEQEQAQKEAEAKRKAEQEQAQKEAEAKRRAEQERVQKEAEAKRKAEQEQAQKEAEAKRKAEQAQALKEAEAKRKAEQEQAQKEAEAKRKAEQEQAQKEAEAKRQAEQAQAQKEAEAKRKAEQEQAQKEAEANRQAEQAQAQKEAEAKRKAEEEKVAALETQPQADEASRRSASPTSQQRADFIMQVQRLLTTCKCYSGDINGNADEIADELNQLMELRQDARRIELASANIGQFEDWLAWMGSVTSEKFTCPEADASKAEREPDAKTEVKEQGREETPSAKRKKSTQKKQSQAPRKPRAASTPARSSPPSTGSFGPSLRGSR